jgi:glucokinase
MTGPRFAVGVDIGGTGVKLGLVGPAGDVAAEDEVATPIELPQRDAVGRIAEAIRRLAGGRAVCAVGIGCAGLVDGERGIVHVSPNLPRWRDARLGEWVAEALGLPVTVLNDANAFALAEARAGAGRGHSPVIGITLGTGVGGAIVDRGRLLGGRHGFGGEIGHMSLAHDGPACPCGNRGCLELYVGRRALVAAYRERAGGDPQGIAERLAASDPEGLSPRRLCEAAHLGDPHARAVFDEAGGLLGVALANLSNLIDPAAFVVGGGVAQAGDLILEPARRVLGLRAMMGAESVAPVLPAALGVRAGLIGAALSAWHGPAA